MADADVDVDVDFNAEFLLSSSFVFFLDSANEKLISHYNGVRLTLNIYRVSLYSANLPIITK